MISLIMEIRKDFAKGIDASAQKDKEKQLIKQYNYNKTHGKLKTPDDDTLDMANMK